uniref:KRAB domain-containing protein n=1 Tax=Rousettus aegyptiacus TaxID=9407 RepID=A0A7J8C2W8_ROUAE|nr:hypothetical protein HJG63_009492 [Rousettus aegyptiacus]
MWAGPGGGWRTPPTPHGGLPKMFEDAAAIFTTVWNFLAFGQQALYRDAMLQGYVQAASQLLVLALGSETSLPLPPAASGSSFLSKYFLVARSAMISLLEQGVKQGASLCSWPTSKQTSNQGQPAQIPG